MLLSIIPHEEFKDKYLFDCPLHIQFRFFKAQYFMGNFSVTMKYNLIIPKGVMEKFEIC